MKNKLIKGLFGIALGISLFAILTGVNAAGDISSVEEESNSASAEVTIGSVETPVYEVYIVWQDLTFDWAYNKETKEFEWKKPKECFPYDASDEEIKQAIENDEVLYSDNTCSFRVYDYQEGEVEQFYYIYDNDESYIGIEDFSQNGQIVPSIKWTPSDKYNHVIGKFSYSTRDSVCSIITDEEMLNGAIQYNVSIYNDNNCTKLISNNNPVYEDDTYYAFVDKATEHETSGEIVDMPDSNRRGGAGLLWGFTEFNNRYDKNQYSFGLRLENDPEKEIVTPVAGDVLGTVTISIRAK